jgi:hypothetical protein
LCTMAIQIIRSAISGMIETQRMFEEFQTYIKNIMQI